MKNYVKRLLPLSVLFHVLLLVGIGMTALSAQSCVSKKEALHKTQSAHFDSIATEALQVKLIGIPEQKVKMNVSLQSLRELPQGASFNKKEGRAEIHIRSDGDSLIVEATCDSLMQQCEMYYNELVRIRSDTANEIKEKKQTVNPLRLCASSLMVGFVLGMLVLVIIKSKFRI